MVKVSIIVPIYNVERYLRQCLDSIANQTLKDIEVICVNDGSKDSSLDIIMEYVNKDSRFKVIDKENSGYGNSMNRGFDMASGEYIGIVESDDYADMFEKLYDIAKENNLDVCKGSFYYYFSKEEKNEKFCFPLKLLKKGVFCPTTDFKSLREQIKFFNIKPTIWSAIYKKDFIRKNKIRFNETPGASYQDASFNFKVWALAERVKLYEACLLHYRQDNEASSMNSRGNVYCVCDEYAEMEKFLCEHPELKGRLDIVKNALKYNTYIWNYERLNEEKSREFLLHASLEFKRDMLLGGCSKTAYPWYKWNNLNFIIANPEEFHKMRQAEKKCEAHTIEGAKNQGVIRTSIKKNGLIHTIKILLLKIKRKFRKK